MHCHQKQTRKRSISAETGISQNRGAIVSIGFLEAYKRVTKLNKKAKARLSFTGKAELVPRMKYRKVKQHLHLHLFFPCTQWLLAWPSAFLILINLVINR
jgi:hypothetical protein